MFVLDPAIERIASDGFKEGLGLAKKVIRSEAFFNVLHDVSDGDIDKDESRRFAQLSFTILPILERVDFDAYALVQRHQCQNFIYFNPVLLYQMVLTKAVEAKEKEQEQPPAEKKPKIDPTESITLGKKELNAFFTAVKAVHEFSHLTHFVCGSRLKLQLRSKALGGGGKRKEVSPQKEVDNVIYKDFGDMVEKKIFGTVVWACHPSEAFAVDELLAIPNPSDASGHPIALTAANMRASEDLSSLKVRFDPTASRSGAARAGISTGRMSGEEKGDDDCRMSSTEELSATY